MSEQTYDLTNALKILGCDWFRGNENLLVVNLNDTAIMPETNLSDAIALLDAVCKEKGVGRLTIVSSDLQYSVLIGELLVFVLMQNAVKSRKFGPFYKSELDAILSALSQVEV